MKGHIDASSPEEYLEKLPEPRKAELKKLHDLIMSTVKLPPSTKYKMLSYGEYHYKYPSGREGDWCIIGLASNKDYISLYVNVAAAQKHKEKLPKAKIGKSCIRFKKVDDLDLEVIKKILQETEKAGGLY